MSQAALYWLQDFETTDIIGTLRDGILNWPELQQVLMDPDGKIVLEDFSRLDLETPEALPCFQKTLSNPKFRTLIWLSCLAAELELRGVRHIRL
jgi:hypothetical protein